MGEEPGLPHEPRVALRGVSIDFGDSGFLILRQRWRRFWFEPGSPANLGFCRALFFGALFLIYFSRDFSAWADVAAVFWRPISLFKILGLSVLPRDPLYGVQVVWKLSLFLSAIGLFTRSSTKIAFVLGTYLLGLQNCFGKIHHADAVLVFAMASLALSRCGDGWSMDRLVRAARRPSEEDLSPSGEYTWPIRMVWLAMACIFFAAGFSKLRHAGLDWITSDTFALFLIQANYTVGRGAEPPLTDWGLWLAQVPWLCRVFATGSMLIELSVPLAIVSRRARRYVVPAVFGVQLGIATLMGPDFVRFMVCYLFWVPWNQVGMRARRSMRNAEKHFLLFDGACGLCQSTVAVLRRLDVFNRMVFYDALRDWPKIHDQFLTLRQEECLENMYVVTSHGRICSGFEAYQALSWSLPLAWPLAPVLYVPGVPWIGRRVYAAVAARRHRAGCPVVPVTSRLP